MEAARRVHVVHRYGEDELPRKPAEPAADAVEKPLPTRAHDVVALIDRLEQGVEMLSRPGLARGRHEHQRIRCAFESPPQRLVPAVFLGGHDHGLDSAAARGDQRFERTGDHARRGVNPWSKDHNPDAGIPHRIAPEVSLERVGEVAIGRRHPASRRFAQTGLEASQRSTAAQ